ncbi:hypothetical protein QTP86_016063, partial [Hemibagrus guttatus]
ATSIESPFVNRPLEIPTCYAPFSDVFCPKRASKLPPHRPWDCAIDLLPGEPVPRGRIYPLSILEEKAMEEYIKEALAQGYICPSTSPAASSFFFVAKKDGGLRPCIDYRALNRITVKFSVYNLIRIREGDEWKTAFITPTGHYEYLVMPYRLTNAPSVFQDFILQFLGYKIDSSGIQMDEGKITAITSLGTGHPGIHETLSLLKERFWWPNMTADVRSHPWSHLGVDFVTDLPTSRNHTCVFVVVDRFSKSCRLLPLKGPRTALETAELIFNHVFRQTERKIQEISRYLRTFCHSHQNSWSQYLGWAEYAQNSLRQPSTGLTPFQCVLGYQPPLFPWSGEPSDVPAVDHWFRESERVWDSAHHQLQRALHRRRRTADLRRSDTPAFQPGQKVCLSTREIRLQPGDGAAEPPLPLLLDDGTAYEVKEILDSRRRGGQLEYLVDWEGYGPEERSWVARDDILDPNLLEAFHTAHPHRPAPHGRGRPPRRWGLGPSGAGRREGGNVTDTPGSNENLSQHTHSPEF